PLRGLTADQLFDSLMQATGGLDPFRLNPIFFGDGSTMPRADFRRKFAAQEKRTEHQTSILQALTLMNGKLVADATSLERSAPLAAIADSPFLDTPGRIEALYLATLARRPRPEEAARMLRYVQDVGARRNPQTALADVFWVLLNSTEFV